jgi:hypothetical protein
MHSIRRETADEIKAGKSSELELRFQILSAEYSHVTSMLGNTWSTTASRTNLFFVAVSAAGIALALFADSSHVTRTSLLLVLVVLLLVLVMGLIALTRMVAANTESIQLMQALIRIRHFFIEIDAGSARYMTLPVHDDESGVYGPITRGSRLSAMTQLPAASMASLVAFVDAFVVAAIAGTAYLLIGGDVTVAFIVSGIALALAVFALMGWLFVRLDRVRRSLVVRFPAAR